MVSKIVLLVTMLCHPMPYWTTQTDSNAVVAVLTFEQGKSVNTDDLQTMNPSIHGCGIVISEEGLILTTRHQLGKIHSHAPLRSNDAEHEHETVWKVLIRSSDKGAKLVPAKLVAADAWSDLAILKIEAPDLRPINIDPLILVDQDQPVSVHADFGAILGGAKKMPHAAH